MPFADNYVQDVQARMNDFVGPGVQWQRALWDVGFTSALRELIHASGAVSAGVLSAKSVKWLALSLDARASHDPGAGEGQSLARLRLLLKGDLTSGGVNHAELSEWTDDVDHCYLARWREALNSTERPSRERTARALTGHLVGEGFSNQALRRWLRQLERRDSVGVVDLVDDAARLVNSPRQMFEVLVLFDVPPGGGTPKPREWVDGPAAASWLAAHGFDRRRQHGGLRIDVGARDPYSAAATAEAVVDRLRARVAVGSRFAISLVPLSFVAGIDKPVPHRASRRAEVRALDREGALLQLDEGGPIDQALELLSHLNTSPDAVAAAAGWSAVESLLTAPGDEDKVVTADRLADLVACSWPRAELTTIAWDRIYQTGKSPDSIARELLDLKTNREKADLILRAIRDRRELRLERPSNQLALNRMRSLTAAPRDELLAVQQRAAACLRRLYRQRNLVVHGGQTAGSALSTALQVAAPLVGAGLDRVTHASLVDNVQPLELAARARFEIHRAGSTTSPPVTALLE